MTEQLPATMKSGIQLSAAPLPEKLNELLLSGASPVVGPNTAAQLRTFAAQPEPVLATQDQVETMYAKLAMATAQAKLSDDEADAQLEMFWLALRDVPIDDLRAGFVELIQTCTFTPKPAEVRSAAMRHGALRRYAKSRARHLAWKHEQEWKPSQETIPPEELRALLAGVKVGA